MARKGLSGQLSMFDFWGAQAGDGEVEMVSLMPEATEDAPAENEPEAAENETPVVAEDEPEAVVKEAPEEAADETPATVAEDEPEVPVEENPVVVAASEPEKRKKPARESCDSPVMHGEKRDSSGKVLAEISYLNYNKVFLRREGEPGETFQFDNSKEAVDFYIAELLKLGCGQE